MLSARYTFHGPAYTTITYSTPSVSQNCHLNPAASLANLLLLVIERVNLNANGIMDAYASYDAMIAD